MAELTPNILSYDITAYLGDTLSVPITWKSGVNPVNFSGCTALCQIKVAKTDTVAVATFNVTLGNSTDNIILSLTAAQVAALGIGKWVYDLQITHTDGSIRTYIVGKLKVTQDVSRA